jgi:hypothetical protein
MIRVLVTGSRDWKDRDFLYAVLDDIPLDEIEAVIEGEAAGADTMAREWAESRGIGDKVLKFPAQWDVYGRAAGPIRNTQMLVEGKPTICIAFSEDLANSRGTKNMVEQARKAGVNVIVAREAFAIEQ